MSQHPPGRRNGDREVGDTAPVPVTCASARHYVWSGACGIACDGWHLVETEGLSVIQERMPPGACESRHRHSRARQFFVVLDEGELVLEVEGVRHVLKAGAGLEVPPGLAHQAMNRGSVAVDFLVVSAPASHGDREPAP